MKSRRALLSVLPVFLLFGCIQTVHKSTVVQGGTYISDRTNTSDLEKASNTMEPEDQIFSPEEKTDEFIRSHASDLSGSSEKLTSQDPESLSMESSIPENNTGNSKPDNETGTLVHVHQKEKIQPVLDEALVFCQASQDFWQQGDLDNALEALDHAYSLILGIDEDDTPKLIQQKEDLRFMIAKRILEIYASRNIVVNGNHNAIPLVVNKHVQNEINRFAQGAEKKFFIESYKRSGKYRPQIVSALKAAGIPEELSWLPLIESGFKVKALSKARALGLWQFIPSTGYKFGLNRDKYIDERIDPVKSTIAAIAYLRELHQIFGDWSTVLAAYNCGEGQVLRVIRSQNINYLDNFWDLYERLPSETARYVPRFIATLYIINHAEKYGLDAIPLDTPLESETIILSKQIHLRDIAKKIGVSQKALVELNPELRYKILPRDKYPLKVPPGKGQVLLAALDTIPVSNPPQRAYVYHRIRPGESLSTIARRYHTRVSRIMRANNLYRSSYIVAGHKLKIPRRGTVVYPSKRYNNAQHKIPAAHIVKRGDSLWIIAKHYRTTTKKIQELNNLKTTHLHIGQILKIPGYHNERPSAEDLKTYKVKRGDSPFQIAQLHNMSLEQLLHINRLTPRSRIYPGQKLFVQ